MSPLIVGIAGGTASGKTTVAERAAERLGAALISHDRYYHSVANYAQTDFDRPEALDTALLVAQLAALRRGEAVALPRYDFARHQREAATDALAPAPILLVEGILVLAEPALRASFDLTVFVHADDDLRLARRIRRDTAERGREWDDVIRQWLASVRPAHLRFVAPYASTAHLVLNGEGSLEAEVARLRAVVDAARSRA